MTIRNGVSASIAGVLVAGGVLLLTLPIDFITETVVYVTFFIATTIFYVRKKEAASIGDGAFIFGLLTVINFFAVAVEAERSSVFGLGGLLVFGIMPLALGIPALLFNRPHFTAALIRLKR